MRFREARYVILKDNKRILAKKGKMFDSDNEASFCNEDETEIYATGNGYEAIKRLVRGTQVDDCEPFISVSNRPEVLRDKIEKLQVMIESASTITVKMEAIQEQSLETYIDEFTYCGRFTIGWDLGNV